MTTKTEPTPEQCFPEIRKLLADGARLFNREHVEALLAESDRLSATLAEREGELADARAENNRLRAGLEWFADEGHYTKVYRPGDGLANVFGAEFARGLLDGKTIEQLEDE